MEDFEIIYVDGVYVIAVNLSYATLNEAIAFRKIAEEEINSGHTRLVIDLSNCVYIDSTFFSAIMMTFRMMEGQGYKLKVVESAITGVDIFIQTNTYRVFDIYKTREEAIKSFEEDIQPES